MDSKDSILTDAHGRRINYLRLSVTDRCNLRCMYCRIRESFQFIPHRDILTYEELLEIIALAEDIGVSKVRLTGGEPFLRKDFEWFLTKVLQSRPKVDLRVTTNATLIADRMETLRDIGLSGLNVSLDTLDRRTYAEITGKDLYPEVRRAVDTGLEAGLRMKINVVAMRGVNDQELPGFVSLAAEHPLDIRFIECMPVGDSLNISRRAFWPADDILEKVQKLVGLEPVLERDKAGGPARMYSIAGGRGRIGVISPLSHHFCGQCNRFRITSDGRLRTCLFSEKEYRLRPLLRSPRLGRKHILKALRGASRKKPMGHELLQERCQSKARDNAGEGFRGMSSIGG